MSARLLLLNRGLVGTSDLGQGKLRVGQLGVVLIDQLPLTNSQIRSPLHHQLLDLRHLPTLVFQVRPQKNDGHPHQSPRRLWQGPATMHPMYRRLAIVGQPSPKQSTKMPLAPSTAMGVRNTSEFQSALRHRQPRDQ